MPGREKHVKRCEELYGYGFEEVHKWMDGTVVSKGRSHREDRHDANKTPEKAYKIFKGKIPSQHVKFIKDAVKDHIELDNRQKRLSKRIKASPCANCGISPPSGYFHEVAASNGHSEHTVKLCLGCVLLITRNQAMLQGSNAVDCSHGFPKVIDASLPDLDSSSAQCAICTKTYNPSGRDAGYLMIAGVWHGICGKCWRRIHELRDLND